MRANPIQGRTRVSAFTSRCISGEYTMLLRPVRAKAQRGAIAQVVVAEVEPRIDHERRPRISPPRVVPAHVVEGDGKRRRNRHDQDDHRRQSLVRWRVGARARKKPHVTFLTRRHQARLCRPSIDSSTHVAAHDRSSPEPIRRMRRCRLERVVAVPRRPLRARGLSTTVRRPIRRRRRPRRIAIPGSARPSRRRGPAGGLHGAVQWLPPPAAIPPSPRLAVAPPQARALCDTTRLGVRSSRRRRRQRQDRRRRRRGRATACSEPEVARERLEHVLPGPHGVRVAHLDRCAGDERPDAVGHDAVRRPVAAADHVAGAGAGDAAASPALKKLRR